MVSAIEITHTHAEENHHHHHDEDSDGPTAQCEGGTCPPHTHEIVIQNGPTLILTAPTSIEYFVANLKSYPDPTEQRPPGDPSLSSIFRPPIS